jgi:L-ascorbate metabolism protein UlaG (beta-lactamase superfamily)
MLLDHVEWLGHSGFRVRAGRLTVYIDPYRVGEAAAPADLILVTHGHYDHFSPRDIEALSHRGTWLVAPASVAEQVGGHVLSIAPGEVIEPDFARGLAIHAIAAYNTSKRNADGRPFHPREAGFVGYDLNIQGERLYHAGDTDVVPEMDDVAGADVALLPVSGTYVMTAEEAAEAARRIQPGVAVPMHWGEHIGTKADATRFAQLTPVPVEIMQPVA